MSTFPTTARFPSEPTLYRNTSPLVDAPGGRSGADVKNDMFGGASTPMGAAEVVHENNVHPDLIKEMYAFVDANGNGVYDTGEAVQFEYQVKVFISRDDSYLRKAFDVTRPEPSEVCLFLEDNSTDLFSGRSSYIKVGSDFQEQLAKRTAIAGIEGGQVDLLTVANDANGTDYTLDYSGAEIEQLIRYGYVINPAQSLLIGMFQLLSVGSFILAPAYTAIGDGLLGFTKKIREYATFKPKDWDPYANADSSKDELTKNFRPALLGFVVDVNDTFSTVQKSAIDFATRQLKKNLAQQHGQLKSSIKSFRKMPMGGYLIPESIDQLIDKAESITDQAYDHLNTILTGTVEIMATLGNKWLYALNAFYCGLWNSLVEAILGILDMIGYLFKGLGAVGDAVSKAQTLVPQALELLDEVVQTIFGTDMIAMVKTAVNAIVKGVSNFNIFSLTGSMSIERVAYFIGNVVGFFVEIVAGIFWSGGLDGVRAFVMKLGKVGDDILAYIMSTVKRVLGGAFKFSLQNMMKLIRRIMELMKKGVLAVQMAIADFFSALHRAAKLADDIIQEIIRMLRLTPDEVRALDDLGLVFVKKDKRGCAACMLDVP